uniref:RING-type domain-containing protein n=1 Tax=Photinus pyralis TaxID=7054 RepID=A0A1Y1LZ18_PHOPY
MDFSWNRTVFIVTFSQIIAIVSSTSGPEDFPIGAALQLSPGDDARSFDDEIPNSFTSAYVNVTYKDSANTWKWERTEVGRYGGGYVGPAFGVVVHVTADNDPSDHSGCRLPFRSSRGDRQLPKPGEPWIALIKRGHCNFESKVDNAFKSKATGVLVYNDRDSVDLDKMKLSNDNDRNISAVFTYKWKGEEIAKLLENDTKVLVHMTIASRSTSPSATINRTSVLFVSVTFIVLMIISLAWLVFYYVQRFRYIHAKDRLSKKLCNAARKALSKIPTKNIKSDDNEVQEGECCAICIEPYKISEVLRMLPCHHEFHKSCIDPWLLEHRTCPMCKMDILRHYGFMVSVPKYPQVYNY